MSEAEEKKSEKAKFKFECTKCGACCHDRGPVPLTLYDIEHWASKKIIDNLFYYMRVQQSPMGITELVLNILPPPKEKKEDAGKPADDVESKDEGDGGDSSSVEGGAGQPEESDDEDDVGGLDDAEDGVAKDGGLDDAEDGGAKDGESGPGADDVEESSSTEKGKCPMYNLESKKCLIWADRPLYCRSFPLGYDGVNFFIKMDDCPGINSVESMGKELLKQMREDAKKEFEGKRLLGIVLPILQGIVMRTMQEDQMKMLSKLSPEQMEKLQKVQEIFSEIDKD
ncbi:MAG: YkgJ family cysteine cluster protein [Promethearchaeota archaeon]